MKAMGLMAGLALAVGCAGCLSAPFQPPVGAVTNYKAPLSTEGNWTAGQKKGSASMTSVLGIVSAGDCSIAAAIKDGGLKSANYVDYDYFNVLGIFQRVTVNVFGD